MGIVNRSDDENRSFSSSSSHLFSFTSLSLSFSHSFNSIFTFYRNFAHARSHSLFLSVSVCPSLSHCRISSISFPNLIIRFNQFDLLSCYSGRTFVYYTAISRGKFDPFFFFFFFFKPVNSRKFYRFVDGYTHIYIDTYMN